MEQGYDWFIEKALHKYVPIFVFVGTFVLLFFTMGLLGKNAPQVELFPVTDPLYVNAFVELPMGKDIEVTNNVLKGMEVKVKKAMEKYDAIQQPLKSLRAEARRNL